MRVIFSRFVILCVVVVGASADDVVVTVGDEVATIDARFASITHDIQDFIGYNIASWDFDWAGSAQLRRLVGALSPMAVRCGGTWEDGMYWAEGPRTGRFVGTKPGMEAHNLTSRQWDPFARFMGAQPGVDLIVGLSALWRHWGACEVKADAVCPGAIPWDERNAASFIAYNRDQN